MRLHIVNVVMSVLTFAVPYSFFADSIVLVSRDCVSHAECWAQKRKYHDIL